MTVDFFQASTASHWPTLIDRTNIVPVDFARKLNFLYNLLSFPFTARKKLEDDSWDLMRKVSEKNF